MASKLIKEFKEFALKGNVIDLAVGVIIGGAFNKVVTAVIDIFLNPLLERLPKTPEGGSGFTGSLVNFAGVLVEFLLTALVLFAIIKAVNSAKNLKKKPEEKPAEPTTRECPFCFSEVSIKATRCPHCTSELPKYAK
ncbi:MAG: large conductance mechanosensitive channel protein MscL [Clostridia bacterium]|nr:large conductance mechanosensitive channel protein MscL [Clostridia bacterium]